MGMVQRRKRGIWYCVSIFLNSSHAPKKAITQNTENGEKDHASLLKKNTFEQDFPALMPNGL